MPGTGCRVFSHRFVGGGGGSGGGVAAVSKALQSAMAVALADSPEPDVIDELRALAGRKRRMAG